MGMGFLLRSIFFWLKSWVFTVENIASPVAHLILGMADFQLQELGVIDQDRVQQQTAELQTTKMQSQATRIQKANRNGRYWKILQVCCQRFPCKYIQTSNRHDLIQLHHVFRISPKWTRLLLTPHILLGVFLGKWCKITPFWLSFTYDLRCCLGHIAIRWSPKCDQIPKGVLLFLLNQMSNKKQYLLPCNFPCAAKCLWFHKIAMFLQMPMALFLVVTLIVTVRWTPVPIYESPEEPTLCSPQMTQHGAPLCGQMEKSCGTTFDHICIHT